MEPLYAARPGGMRLVRNLLVLSFAGTAAIAVALLALADTTAALVTALALVATVGLIWAILPRRYELWPDHLAIVFPLWRWRVRFESIDVVRDAYQWEPYAFIGYRFATAPSQAVTVLRHNSSLLRHPNLVISPEDREEFLRQLHRAMQR